MIRAITLVLVTGFIWAVLSGYVLNLQPAAAFLSGMVVGSVSWAVGIMLFVNRK